MPTETLGTPLVSVVIPAFNASEVIQQALQSVFNQKVQIEYEVVVVDDGSLDETWEVLQRAADECKLLRIYRQHNQGPGAARNKGVNEARGCWILFLDSDDLMFPGRIEHQASQILEYQNLAVHCGSIVVDGRKGLSSTPHGSVAEKAESFVVSNALSQLLARGNFISTSAVAVRRDAYLAAGGQREDLRCGEDFDLWIRLAANGARFAYTTKLYSWYRRSPRGLMASEAPLTDDFKVLASIPDSVLKGLDPVAVDSFKKRRAQRFKTAAFHVWHKEPRAFSRFVNDNSKSTSKWMIYLFRVAGYFPVCMRRPLSRVVNKLKRYRRN